MRRTLSLMLAIAMITSVVATAVEAAVGTWLSPQPGQLVPAGKVEVAIGFNTQSEAKVSTLELYVDGKFAARKLLVAPTSRGVCSFWWDATKASKGKHDLMVKIFSGSTLIAKVTGTGTVGSGSSAGLVDTRPPKVMFANIKANDVLKGLAKVHLDASDDSGDHPLVSLLVDNSLKMLRNTPPYSYDLDTTTYTNGSHKLETYAYDAAGNRSDPAVLTVSFKNNQPKPVIATMSVDPKPVTVTEEDGAVATVLASKPTSEAPKVTVTEAPKATVTPAATSCPTNVRVASVPPSLRTEKPSLAATSAPRASEPAAVSEPAAAAPIASAPKVTVTPAPKVSPAAASSPSAVRIAALPPSLRTDSAGSTVVSTPRASEPAAVSEPVEQKPLPAAAVSAPKPVRVALAPDLRSLKTHPRLQPGVAAVPTIEKPTEARIEKKIAPVSGKVKARDLIEQMGGVVFWDPITHTMTALVQGMKIEMRIGSNVALVNGQEMKVGVAPSIANGRTIIDASVYRQACAFAAEAAKSANAQ